MWKIGKKWGFQKVFCLFLALVIISSQCTQASGADLESRTEIVAETEAFDMSVSIEEEMIENEETEISGEKKQTKDNQLEIEETLESEGEYQTIAGKLPVDLRGYQGTKFWKLSGIVAYYGIFRVAGVKIQDAALGKKNSHIKWSKNCGRTGNWNL